MLRRSRQRGKSSACRLHSRERREVLTQMVVLYNRFGESFSFSTHTWTKLLAIASRYGWKPSGTIAPPKTWDLDHPKPVSITWDGNYSRPSGQTVRPKDAQCLGQAIERALAAEPRRGTKKQRLRAFTVFCRERGFILSKFFSGVNTGPIRRPAL